MARVPRGGGRVRDRLGVRRRAAAGRLRVRDRRGARAHARRPAEPGRARHARVPDRGAPGGARRTRPAPSSSSTTAPRSPTDEAAEEAHAIYAELVEQATDRTPDPEEIGAMSRVRDGGDGRVRAGGQAGPARPALGDRAAAARHAPVPRRDQAAGLRRARAGPRALERQGPLRRLSVSRGSPSSASTSPLARPRDPAGVRALRRCAATGRRRGGAAARRVASSSCWAAACSAVKPPAWRASGSAPASSSSRDRLGVARRRGRVQRPHARRVVRLGVRVGAGLQQRRAAAARRRRSTRSAAR